MLDINDPSATQISIKLKSWFESVWDIERYNNGKLGFYNQVKDSFGCELYMKLQLSYAEHKAIAQLRSSSHKLQIEVGRYGTDRDNVLSRVCSFCTSDSMDNLTWLSHLPMFDPVIEDELHVLTECPHYASERATVGPKLWHSLTTEGLLKSIFNDKSSVQNLSRFVSKIWKKRAILTDKTNEESLQPDN